MNTTTWRRLGALAVLPLIGASLAACGSDADAGSGSQTITFAYQIANPNAKSVFETLAQEYEKTHAGVTIKTNPIALNTYGSTITTQLQAGNGPDVFFINAGGGQAGSVGTLGEAGKLLDLTGKVADGAVPENAVSSMSYNDKLVAVPVYLAPAGIIFSPMAAEKSGFKLDANSTMDDVIAQCKTVADGGQAVFGLAGAMAPNTAIFTSAIAASTVYGPDPQWNEEKASGEKSFADTPGWRDALQTVKDLYDAGCFQEGAAGAGFDALTNGMGQGQMLGFSAPGGAAKDIMDSTGGHVTLTVEAMPAPAGYDTYLMAGTPDAIAGNAASGNKDLVLDFIDWMSQPAQTKAAAEAAGDIPVSATDTSKLLPQYAGVASLIDEGKVAQYPYIEWPNGEVYNALGTGVTGLLTGQMSVDDVLASLDKAWG
ncbi:ABC transporter substrate-binding protein [Nocardioides sp. LS1]|uniref:ABC transporter substrate-binding protein n=1 Tax=Nocardioides sp. LS1 TaxID=1027620 RepID=UPI000F624A7D|nr:ABC transporter substrate-binding protein [Nocardioides sp. LS1]GCD89947.1 ABC transporter substrate-binding protein [Nocardioides sp. LS1]